MRVRRFKPSCGFTLIELMVVIFVIVVFVSLAAPNLVMNERHEIRREAIYFSNVLQWLTEQSIATQQRHRLVVNLAEQRYFAEVETPSLSTVERDEDAEKSVFQRIDGAKTQREINQELMVMKPSRALGNDHSDVILVMFDSWGPERHVAFTFSSTDEEADSPAQFRVSYQPMGHRPLVSQIDD